MQAPETASTSKADSGKGCLCFAKSKNRSGRQRANRYKPKARTKERQGVGMARRLPACSVPSGFIKNPPTIPTREWACSATPMRTIELSSSTQSGFRNKMTLSVANLIPRLHPAEKPRLLSAKITCKRSSCGKAKKKTNKQQTKKTKTTTNTNNNKARLLRAQSINREPAL